jgi:hypothetical protein
MEAAMPEEARVGSSDVWTREEAIARLRARLIVLADGEQSVCRMAAEHGIFCRGFSRFGDAEFHRRWRRALGHSTHLNRPQLERLADVWVLSEQVRTGMRLACDLPRGSGQPCRGWDEFGNGEIERFCLELLERVVAVVDATPAAS